MPVSDVVRQFPEPGRRFLAFRGDVRTFRLTLARSRKGGAWLRTNIGWSHVARQEVIRQVHHNEAPQHRDWFDIPMRKTGESSFEVVLPLGEVGHFEAKAYFLPDGEQQPVWPPGENTVINVEPADTICGNIVYNAFIRQFGPNKCSRKPLPEKVDFEILDRDGFTVIPPSGTFRSFISELDFIIDELGCRYIQLLPIHPTPTTYGRMGRFGSPYAAQRFRAVDPAMAEFDPKATPLEQFLELVDAVHKRHARIILDIAINHTGWAARLHDTHPEWLIRSPDGKIQVPGAWGVRWEDLTKLDYRHKDLWQYMAEMFLTWCRRGVDGFRCDAGYMIPVATWRYITARVREEYPDTLFFLEGLGGKVSVTRDILNRANFNWAYSELFQNYDRGQIEYYLPDADKIAAEDGLMVHFAETHDNNRLAATSQAYARMRTALCALLAPNGAFAFANGVEWFATEKINVHDAPSLNWGAAGNQVDQIRRLATLLKVHPAFEDRAGWQFIQAGDGNFLAAHRFHAPTAAALLILVNLDHIEGVTARWRAAAMPAIDNAFFIDLLTGERITVETADDIMTRYLSPGQVLCLTADPEDLPRIEAAGHQKIPEPRRCEHQRLRAKVMEIFCVYNGVCDIGEFDPDREAVSLKRDPLAFCRHLNPNSDESRVILWQWPADEHRTVMVPPGHFLMVSSATHFQAQVVESGRTLQAEKSFPIDDGRFFALFAPLPVPDSPRFLQLGVSVYVEEECVHIQSPLLYLSDPDQCRLKTSLGRQELLNAPMTILGTNGRGAMMRASTFWGELNSRYDGLLFGNPDPSVPVDRWVMLSRCRAWIVHQDYSQDVRTDCLRRFVFDYESAGRWIYRIPTGLGQHIDLTVTVVMTPKKNEVAMVFHRHRRVREDEPEDDVTMRLIIRPDIESRSFHDTTKAYLGPEDRFRAAIRCRKQGFRFSPDPVHVLDVDVSGSTFSVEPEWYYMVYHPVESDRGLDPHSDLFSPGYFEGGIRGGESIVLTARMVDPQSPPLEKGHIPEAAAKEQPEHGAYMPFLDALRSAMDHFVAARGKLSTVIAGYPWFLDWGRDSLIFTRGLIAAGRYSTAREILTLFGQFEENGTLPNMIRGNDAANRDTSDAPLWFVVACRDLAAANGPDFLDSACGGRTIREILFSIVNAYIAGTGNGVRMDPESGLIFSPAHFTWMDTNYPAGTPREGYPIEIQALWHAALVFLSKIRLPGKKRKTEKIDLQKLSDRVAAAVLHRYFNPDIGYCADCLHSPPGKSPEAAIVDDALRPNQLFAITLGAITDPEVSRKILSACAELLVPGAIRSLADRPVSVPVEIRHNGQLLGDPERPYRGCYFGDEDSSRKPAYHNGTAWTWVFPSFCEAWAAAYGDTGKDTARAWLGSGEILLNQGCLGQLPEVVDGDTPHHQRGCDAQAWSVSEYFRVWKLLLTG